MTQKYRDPRESWTSDQAAGFARGGRYRSGTERDRYQTGGEQRYAPENDRPGQSAGFRGQHSYENAGYAEETGYRRGPNQLHPSDDQRDMNRADQPERHWGEGRERDQPTYRSPPRAAADHTQEQNELYDWFDRDNRHYDARGYFGTGNYAGVDEFAPLTRYRGGHFYGGRQRDNDFDYPGSTRGTWAGYDNAPRVAAQPRFEPEPPADVHSSRSGQYSNAPGGPSPEFRGPAPRYDHSYARPNSDVLNRAENPRWGNSEHDAERQYAPEQYAGTSHRGRGPRGYERSDERLREIICERLTDDPYIDASDVHVEVSSRKVQLSGTVANRRTKYEIEELIERSTNVRDIDNQLKVQAQPWASGQEQRMGSATSNASNKQAEVKSNPAQSMSSSTLSSRKSEH
jgi:hypothetical protein